MESLIDQIRAYQPINLQEQKDRAMMLHYCEQYEDLLTRNNETAHFTSSSLILNETRDRALLIHHKIYNAWGWTGGHLDGNADALAVAIKEAKEETGLTTLTPLSDQIMTLDILPVIGHMKNGEYVAAHLHLSLAYLLIADESDPLLLNQLETNGVAWFDLKEVAELEDEPHMTPIYRKLIARL